jgi:outer membrane protein TolC
MAQTRFRTGLANQLTVFNAETAFLQAREQQVALDADAVTQRVTLLLALGGGFDPKNPAPMHAQSNISQDTTP